MGLCGTGVPYFQPMYALSLFVYLYLARNLSHTLNIFIFSCNFPGAFPNLTRERSIPLFRFRLPALQISCLLLWLQRDANILVQALRSIQHTIYCSVFHFHCPSCSCSFFHHSLSCFHPLTLSLLPIRESKVVFYQFPNSLSSLSLTFFDLYFSCSSSSISCKAAICDPALLYLPSHFKAPTQQIYSQSDVSFSPISLLLACTFIYIKAFGWRFYLK